MISFLCFVQIIFGSSGNDIFLMLQVISQHIQQIHNFRLIVDQRQHYHTKSILQLCMLVQLIQNNIGIGILTKLNDHADTFTVGFITDICDTIDFL